MASYQAEMSTKEVVKLIEAEVDDGGDILDELKEEDVREIYKELTPGYRKKFRQFRRFHRQYFGVFGEHLPSYHVARQVVRDLMPGIPSSSADIIAAKWAEILAEDRLRELCKQHGYKFPEREMRVSAAEPTAPAEPTYHFPSLQDEQELGIATTSKEQLEEEVGIVFPTPEGPTAAEEAPAHIPRRVVPAVIKMEAGEDVKPLRLQTAVRSQRSLLQWEGLGDEELIITRVQKGNDPLGQYYADEEVTQVPIEVEDSDDTEDDLSVVSMESDGDISREKLKTVLKDLATSHHATAAHLDT